jgi:hypothetical protein
MLIIGCDYHPSWQQICWLETSTGETGEERLEHSSGEATRFYRQLSEHALIGMESTGNCQWFVEMVTTAGHDVWIGDAARTASFQLGKKRSTWCSLILARETNCERDGGQPRPRAIARMDSRMRCSSTVSSSVVSTLGSLKVVHPFATARRAFVTARELESG